MTKWRDLTPKEVSYLALIAFYKDRSLLKRLGPIARKIGIAILDNKGIKKDIEAAKGMLQWAKECQLEGQKRLIKRLFL